MAHLGSSFDPLKICQVKGFVGVLTQTFLKGKFLDCLRSNEVEIRSASVKVYLLKNQLSRSKLKSSLKPGPRLSEKAGPSVEKLK